MTAPDELPSHTVVVGVDGSNSSVAAARWAFEQARLTGSRVEVVSAWQPSGSWGLAWGIAMPIPADLDPAAATRSLVDEIVGTLEPVFPTVRVSSRIEEGHPAEVLVDASRHAALLVVGNRGHGGFSGLLIGSVSQHRLSRGDRPGTDQTLGAVGVVPVVGLVGSDPRPFQHPTKVDHHLLVDVMVSRSFECFGLCTQSDLESTFVPLGDLGHALQQG